MKNLLLFLIATSLFSVNAQQPEVVGGYFPYWRSTDNINFSNYNYLYFAFAFPTPAGGLQFSNATAETAFADFKSKTTGIGSKRLISIGGTGMSEMADDSLTRLAFADTLRKFCRIHDFDGIDMDWEAINSVSDRDNFTALMKDIRSEIDTTDLEFVITVGFGNYWLQWYENDALDQADFLQIMIYDQTGTWAGSPYGSHASMDHFKQAETYWLGRGYSRDQLVMGLPYYGYRFNDTSGGLATAVTYTEIMAQFPNALPSDNLLIDQTGHYFFNGADLIQEKIGYAKSNGFKGVFVWELAQDDATREKSLDAALSEEISTVTVLEQQGKSLVTYPNPAHDILKISVENVVVENVEIFTSIGELVYCSPGKLNVSIIDFPIGIYVVRITSSDQETITTTFIKE